MNRRWRSVTPPRSRRWDAPPPFSALVPAFTVRTLPRRGAYQATPTTAIGFAKAPTPTLASATPPRVVNRRWRGITLRRSRRWDAPPSPSALVPAFTIRTLPRRGIYQATPTTSIGFSVVLPAAPSTAWVPVYITASLRHWGIPHRRGVWFVPLAPTTIGQTCPLYPSPDLYPAPNLYPCGGQLPPMTWTVSRNRGRRPNTRTGKFFGKQVSASLPSPTTVLRWSTRPSGQRYWPVRRGCFLTIPAVMLAAPQLASACPGFEVTRRQPTWVVGRRQGVFVTVPAGPSVVLAPWPPRVVSATLTTAAHATGVN